MPQRELVPRPGRRPRDHRGLADRLQHQPAPFGLGLRHAGGIRLISPGACPWRDDNKRPRRAKSATRTLNLNDQFWGAGQLGLRPKDNPLDLHQIARISAARLSKWLERAVRPSQEYLIDAAHLVLKFPSLFDGDTSKPALLNQTTARNAEETGLDTEKLKQFAFEKSFWLNRPSWWWRRLRNHEEIAEVRDPWSVERPDVVFCEDVSEFLPRTAAKDFVASVASPAPQRWVVNTETEEGKVYSEDLRGVSYMPPVRFTL